MSNTQGLKLLDREVLIKVMPSKCKNYVSQELVDEVNKFITADPQLAESYRDNVLGYIDVIQDGKYKVESYLNAVKYVTYKLFGDNNTVAYAKTFPDRYQRLLSNGASSKDLAAYASNYNKTKLVNIVFSRTLIPTHILNADLHQEAINAQAHLMRTAVSEKVRCDAANSLLHHLKAPEGAQLELDVSEKKDSLIEDLKLATRALAQQQLQSIERGTANAKTIAESSIIRTVPAAD